VKAFLAAGLLLASALTVFYAWTVLRERPARAILIGAALVCAGVVILAL